MVFSKAYQIFDVVKRICFTAVVLLSLTFSFRSYAATADTINIYSAAMRKDYKCVVIQPGTDQNEKKAFPVVYLLHGYGGWYSNWITRVPELKDYADQYQLMIVCPEGMNSWYLDSPIDSNSKFETYIAREIVEFIDSHYPTIKNRKARAITGLSMGGHGGLFLGFRNAHVFGACGSMSGGVDFRPFPKRWDLIKRLGDTVTHAANWSQYSVINVVENKPSDSIAIIFDCGIDDFFYSVNQQLHQKLLNLKIPHDYSERPGKHDWTYWKNSIKYHLLFFREYFTKSGRMK